MTLKKWKKLNNIYTHKANQDIDFRWAAWGEIECPFAFDEKYGFNNMGYGDTKQEAILAYCQQQEIEPPFWW